MCNFKYYKPDGCGGFMEVTSPEDTEYDQSVGTLSENAGKGLKFKWLYDSESDEIVEKSFKDSNGSNQKMNDVEIIEVLSTIFPKHKDYLWSDDCDLYDFVEEHLEMCKDQFGKIIEMLIPLASRWKSELTDIEYSGFVDTKRQIALVKRELEK